MSSLIRLQSQPFSGASLLDLFAHEHAGSGVKAFSVLSLAQYMTQVPLFLTITLVDHIVCECGLAVHGHYTHSV